MENWEKEKLAELALSLAERLGDRMAFDIFDFDDFVGEIYLLLVRAYPKYGVDSPESHYYTFVKNRLLNMRRDKMTHSDDKFNLLHPMPLKGDNLLSIDNTELRDIIEEFQEVVDDKLASSLRETYMRFLEGAPLLAAARIELKRAVTTIVAAHKREIGYDD